MRTTEEKIERAKNYVLAHNALYATLGILAVALFAISCEINSWIGGSLSLLSLAPIAFSERKMRKFIDGGDEDG